MRGFKVHIILAGLFLFVHAPAFSQVNFPLNLKLADSLEKILPTISGKEKIDALNEISFALIRHYSNRSDSIAKIAVDLARKINYKEGLAKALFCKGTNDYINGNFIKALTKLHDALTLNKEIADTNMIIETLYQIGAVSYFSFTDLNEGINCGHNCLDYAKAAGFKHWESQMYSSLQYLYGTAGDYENALKYLKIYSSFAKEMALPRLEETMVIAAYGREYFQMGEYRKALDQYLLAWPRVNPADIEERAYLAQLTHSMGDAYNASGMPDSAAYYFNLGLALSGKNKHNCGSMMNSLKLARQYLTSGDPAKSAVYCVSTIYFGNLIDSLSSFYGIREYSRLLGMSGELYIPLNKQYKRFLAWKVMAGAYQILMRIREQQGEYRNALLVNIQFNRINDSIANFQKRTEILDLQYKYQAEQKDDEIKLLSQENQIQSFKISRSRLILFSVIAISVLLLFILILVLRQNRIKSGRKVAEFKQRLLRSQMNPHFIFNSLTSIQNFILQQDDIKASIYLSRFSDLVRNILNNSQEEFINLEAEISTIENYLSLQKIRFPDKFDYIIDIDPGIDIESVMIPPMLAQPFIENAIEHGIKHKEWKGRIAIRIRQTIEQSNSRTIEQAMFEVEDDGVGREKAKEILQKQDKDHKSLATVITRERIAALNRRSKKKITLEIIDLKDDEGNARGTLVRFGLPVM
ncbi:MAG: sensor histidine kinase [Lentimicrobium sp.]|nr:sensor histidine kinase [Lentimicrobium sp.]